MSRRAGSSRGSATAVLLSSAVLIAGCSGAQPRDEVPATTGEASGSVTSTMDPRAKPAVAAYEAFTRTSQNATRRPLPHGTQYPPADDFTRHSFDPARAEYLGYVSALAELGVAFRGTPPEPRTRVESVEPDARPYPKVVLTDCEQPSPSWLAYDEDGRPQPVASASVAPPYLITVTMIYFEDHWGVQATTTDTSRTCTR